MRGGMAQMLHSTSTCIPWAYSYTCVYTYVFIYDMHGSGAHFTLCFGFLHLQNLATIFCNPCVFCTHTHAESVWYCCGVQWMWLCYACGPLHTAPHFLCPDWRKRPNHHQRLVIVCTQPCRCDFLVWGSVSHEQELHEQTSRDMHLPPAYQGRQRD